MQYNPPLDHISRAIATQGRRMNWLAAKAGISQGHLTHILAGERRLQPAVAQRIADALGLPLDYVLQGTRGEVPA
jgi:plasmid maintenance system antidote protein VapI